MFGGGGSSAWCVFLDVFTLLIELLCSSAHEGLQPFHVIHEEGVSLLEMGVEIDLLTL